MNRTFIMALTAILTLFSFNQSLAQEASKIIISERIICEENSEKASSAQRTIMGNIDAQKRYNTLLEVNKLSGGYTGYSVKLPPGIWEVKGAAKLSIANTSDKEINCGFILAKVTVTDKQKANETSKDIIGNSLSSSNLGYNLGRAGDSNDTKTEVLNWNFIVNNKSDSEKIYYIKIQEIETKELLFAPDLNNIIFTYSSAKEGENYIYAKQISLD